MKLNNVASTLISLALSELPAFLVAEGGLNSGFMIAHCTAAALGKYRAYLNWGVCVGGGSKQ